MKCFWIRHFQKRARAARQTKKRAKGKDYSFKNKWYKMMCLQQSFFAYSWLTCNQCTQIDERRNSLSYRSSRTFNGACTTNVSVQVTSLQLVQNSTIMLILNKFQVAKKLADNNHEIHSFKYAFRFNVIGRVKSTNSSLVIIMAAISPPYFMQCAVR